MSNAYRWPRIAGPDPDLRASDAERERTAERLRTSHAEGRLELAEFQQRVERSLEAKTVGELEELVIDLPRREELNETRSFRPSRLLLVRVAPILIALIIVSAATGHHLFWLWIPLVFLLWRMSWGWRRRQWAGAWRGHDDWT